MATMLWKCLFPLEDIMPGSHNIQLSIENITMAADTFALLSPDHLHSLPTELTRDNTSKSQKVVNTCT